MILGNDAVPGFPAHLSFPPLAVSRPRELGPKTATYSAGSITAFVYAKCRLAPFSIVEQPTSFASDADLLQFGRDVERQPGSIVTTSEFGDTLSRRT